LVTYRERTPISSVSRVRKSYYQSVHTEGLGGGRPRLDVTLQGSFSPL